MSSTLMNNFGLNDDLLYRELEFDSYDCVNSLTTGVLKTNWPNFQLTRPLNNIAALKILEVQIPFTWYTINNNNNTFKLNDGAGTTVVTLPIGNYDSSSLATALGTALTTASAGSHTFTVTYASLTQKFTIVSNQTSGSFTFTMAPSDMIEGNFDPSIMLGMNRVDTSSTYSVGFPATLISPNVALITGPNYLYVNSSKVGQSTNLYLPGQSEFHVQSEGLGPQLAKIPVNCNPGGIIFWQDPGLTY